MLLVSGLIRAFWAIVNTLLSLFGIASVITHLQSVMSLFTNSLSFMASVVANVYYFVPKSVLLPLLLLSIGFAVIRIALALINLIWW